MSSWWRLPVSGLVTAGLVTGALVSAPPAAAEPWDPPEPQRVESVAVREVTPREKLRKAPAEHKLDVAEWPEAETASDRKSVV